MEQNLDEGRMSPRKSTREYGPKLKWKYEIFGALRATDMIIEIYTRKMIGRNYLQVKP